MSNEITTRCAGMTWKQVRNAGLLRELWESHGGSVTRMCRSMGWNRTGGVRDACEKFGPFVCDEPEPESQDREEDPSIINATGLRSQLANQLLSHVRRAPQKISVLALSDRFDRSPRSVREALATIKAAGYQVELDAESDTAAIHTAPKPDYVGGSLPGWGEYTIRFCAISDTHCENLCCAWDELHAVYQRCADEGITDVIHAGNLSDGPGSLGYPSHYLEVADGCHDVYGCLKFLHDRYPRFDGITTHHISSSTCHEGWAFKAKGIDMGYSLANGYTRVLFGPNGEEVEHVPPRPDLHHLGMDAYTITCGPEGLTKVLVFHPGGGSSYATSYRSQKWAESLQGGNKPHMGILGHFHKSSSVTVRDIRVLQPGCLEWQTGFMQKHHIQAHVTAWFVELHVDTGGSLRRVCYEEMPFYFEPKKFYHMSDGVPNVGTSTPSP